MLLFDASHNGWVYTWHDDWVEELLINCELFIFLLFPATNPIFQATFTWVVAILIIFSITNFIFFVFQAKNETLKAWDL